MNNKIKNIIFIVFIAAIALIAIELLREALIVNEKAELRLNEADGYIPLNATNQTNTTTLDPLVEQLAQQKFDALALDVEVDKAYRQKLIDYLKEKCQDPSLPNHDLICEGIPNE
jgi:hypothetical protein